MLSYFLLLSAHATSGTWEQSPQYQRCGDMDSRVFLGTDITLDECKAACLSDPNCGQIFGQYATHESTACWTCSCRSGACTTEPSVYADVVLTPDFLWLKSPEYRRCGDHDSRVWHGSYHTLEQCQDLCFEDANCGQIFGVFNEAGDHNTACWTCSCPDTGCTTENSPETYTAYTLPQALENLPGREGRPLPDGIYTICAPDGTLSDQYWGDIPSNKFNLCANGGSGQPWGGDDADWAAGNQIRYRGSRTYNEQRHSGNWEFRLVSNGHPDHGEYTICIPSCAGPDGKLVDLCLHGHGGVASGNPIKYHGGREYNENNPNGRWKVKRVHDDVFTICAASGGDLCIHGTNMEHGEVSWRTSAVVPDAGFIYYGNEEWNSHQPNGKFRLTLVPNPPPASKEGQYCYDDCKAQQSGGNLFSGACDFCGGNLACCRHGYNWSNGKQHCDETLRGEKGREYLGCQTKTRSGLTCKPWSETSFSSGFADYGLTDNYCRNPDGGQTIWCYTTTVTSEGKTWEYCDPKPREDYYVRGGEDFCDGNNGAILDHVCVKKAVDL